MSISTLFSKNFSWSAHHNSFFIYHLNFSLFSGVNSYFLLPIFIDNFCRSAIFIKCSFRRIIDLTNHITYVRMRCSVLTLSLILLLLIDAPQPPHPKIVSHPNLIPSLYNILPHVIESIQFQHYNTPKVPMPCLHCSTICVIEKVLFSGCGNIIELG